LRRVISAILMMAVFFLVSPMAMAGSGGGTTPTYHTQDMGISCNSRMNPCPTALSTLPNVTSVACTMYTCKVTYADCGAQDNYNHIFNASTGYCESYPVISVDQLCSTDLGCGPNRQVVEMHGATVTYHHYCDKNILEPFGTCKMQMLETEPLQCLYCPYGEADYAGNCIDPRCDESPSQCTSTSTPYCTYSQYTNSYFCQECNVNSDCPTGETCQWGIKWSGELGDRDYYHCTSTP